MKYQVLPLRDLVIYPNIMTPLFIGRENSILAIEEAFSKNKQIALLTQKNGAVNFPKSNDLFHYGVLAKIVQITKLPDNTIKILVEAQKKIKITVLEEDISSCELEDLIEFISLSDAEIIALGNVVKEEFIKYNKIHKKQPTELIDSIIKINDLSKLLDIISSYLPISILKKINILKETNIEKRAYLIMSEIEGELTISELEQKIKAAVKQQIDKNQKEYYLNEQAKAIQKELEVLDGNKNEFNKMVISIKEAKMPKEIEEKCLNEVDKIKKMPSMSSETSVIRNYLEVMLSYPWNKSTKQQKTLKQAKDVLEESHYGLREVKKSIIEYLAVQSRKNKNIGSILCLVGPPGVGKTSIGKSIAEATSRNYIRMSLGGMRDEAEIRGHRKTYIGAMPGKIVQNIIKSGVNNPLFLLDEIDKIGMDQRGDPASAMLEVLDPEQNSTFNDHFLEVDTDLSNIMFIATANSLNIPKPLLDRMEIIHIPGYSEREKLAIAKKYLLVRNKEKTGLKENEVSFTNKALEIIIENYTREAGVRELDRQINKICRKVLLEISLEDKTKVSINQKNIQNYLGVAKYRHDTFIGKNTIGRISGLAWTSIGGEILNIETIVLPGNGQVKQTGKLGEVMKESIETAFTVAKKYAYLNNISANYFKEHDFHIHLPEGAVPKDGPSAGTAIACVLLSAILQKHIPSDLAMTGEINLHGDVLAIGGLKEKLFAASREKLKKVIIPKENEKDLEDIDEEIKNNLEIICVQNIEEILHILFVNFMNKKEKSNEALINMDNYLIKKEEQISKH